MLDYSGLPSRYLLYIGPVAGNISYTSPFLVIHHLMFDEKDPGFDNGYLILASLISTHELRSVQ